MIGRKTQEVILGQLEYLECLVLYNLCMLPCTLFGHPTLCGHHLWMCPQDRRQARRLQRQSQHGVHRAGEIQYSS